jgi:hypothetical protein
MLLGGFSPSLQLGQDSPPKIAMKQSGQIYAIASALSP